MSASTASPDLVFSRYFLSQMSWDAGCIGISLSAIFVLTASRRTVLMPVLSPFYRVAGRGRPPMLFLWLCVARHIDPERRRRGSRSHDWLLRWRLQVSAALPLVFGSSGLHPKPAQTLFAPAVRRSPASSGLSVPS